MSTRTPHLHFWTDREVEGVAEWDPDAEPHQHASGYGHTFLELFVRMSQDRRAVTIGRRAPRGTTVLVASLEELTDWLPRCEPSLVRSLAREVLRTGAALVVIRADVHPEIQAPPMTSLEVRPTRQAVEDAGRHAFLPLLPQRGLVPRAADRGPQVTNVALKAYRKNVPCWLTGSFASELEQIGIVLRIDTEQPGSRAWGDFSDVDVALCSQPTDSLGVASRKPATKLVNAWCAGAIPLVVPRLPYADIGVDGTNMLTAASPEEVISVLRRLKDDPALVRRLFVEVPRAGRGYDVATVTAMWWDLLSSTREGSRRTALRCLVQEYAAALRRRVARTPAPRSADDHR